MGQFIGNSGSDNILHLHTGSRQVTDQAPRQDTIFHSQMPNIVVVQELAQTYSTTQGGYKIFQFPTDVLSTWDTQNYVYLIQVTHDNGQVRLLSGFSQLETGVMDVQMIGIQAASCVNYLSTQSFDQYSSQLWLSNAYGVNYDQTQQTRMANAVHCRGWSLLGGGPGSQAVQWQMAVGRFATSDNVLPNQQVALDNNSKTYLAIASSRSQLLLGDAVETNDPTSNYKTDLTVAFHHTAFRLSPLSMSSTYGSQALISDSPVASVKQLRTNLLFNGSSFSFAPIFSQTSQISISNSQFVVGGVDLRTQGYGILTQQSTSNPDIAQNAAFTSQQASPSMVCTNMNQGFNYKKIPVNSSWELNANTPSIKVGGVDLWSPSNIPLKFLSQFSINVPAVTRQYTQAPAPTRLQTISTGSSQGAITAVVAQTTTTTNLFYSCACFAFIPAPIYTDNVNAPVLPGGQYTSIGRNYTLLNLPVNYYVPLSYSYSKDHKYTIYLRNTGDGVIEVWDMALQPSSIHGRGSFTSPNFTLTFARLT